MVSPLSGRKLDDGLASPFPYDVAAERRPRANDCASGAAADESFRDGTVDGVSAIRPDRAADNDQFRVDDRLSGTKRLVVRKVTLINPLSAREGRGMLRSRVLSIAGRHPDALQGRTRQPADSNSGSPS